MADYFAIGGKDGLTMPDTAAEQCAQLFGERALFCSFSKVFTLQDSSIQFRTH